MCVGATACRQQIRRSMAWTSDIRLACTLHGLTDADVTGLTALIDAAVVHSTSGHKGAPIGVAAALGKSVSSKGAPVGVAAALGGHSRSGAPPKAWKWTNDTDPDGLIKWTEGVSGTVYDAISVFLEAADVDAEMGVGYYEDLSARAVVVLMRDVMKVIDLVVGSGDTRRAKSAAVAVWCAVRWLSTAEESAPPALTRALSVVEPTPRVPTYGVDMVTKFAPEMIACVYDVLLDPIDEDDKYGASAVAHFIEVVEEELTDLIKPLRTSPPAIGDPDERQARIDVFDNALRRVTDWAHRRDPARMSDAR